MEQTCSICGSALDPSRWLQVEAPCGHRFHFVCGRQQLAPRREAAATTLECAACVALITSTEDGLALLSAECSGEIDRGAPTDVELHYCTELRLGREVRLLKQVPDVILRLHGLRCLDLNGHPITRLPPAIGCLKSVTRFVLVGLYLTELPDEIGDMVSLGQLYCTGTGVRAIPERTSRLEYLWELYFDGNQLRSLPEVLPPLVDSFKVSGNELTSLPEDMSGHTSMKNIRAYGNRLTRLPDSLCAMDKLCDVLLQGNELRALPEQLGQCGSIRTLLVHDNHLEKLPESLTQLTDLRWLYLYGNRLRDLPRGLLRSVPLLERLLLEDNPLSAATMEDLFQDVPSSLRTFGIDASQVCSLAAAHEAAGQPAPPCLPACATSGWMLPWPRLYAKLLPASQLKRPAGVPPLCSPQPAYGGDLLVVAFAASQGEPEWFGCLGQVLGAGSRAQDRVLRGPDRSFADLYAEVHGGPVAFEGPHAAGRAGGALWARPAAGAQAAGEARPPLRDFDVLSLCETNAQWYADTDHLALGVEAKLGEICRRYRRVMFVGTSMGGFGALSNAHLASTVAVFGPQTDLRHSHLRPGFGANELDAATRRMRKNVLEALSGGTRIEYHVGLEEHLVYARQLPLPRHSLVVHPVHGRIARNMERGGVMVPLLVELISELQCDAAAAAPRRVPEAVAFAEAAERHAERHLLETATLDSRWPKAWDWSSDEETVQIGHWGRGDALAFVRASGRQLWLLSQDPARLGDCFCTSCWARNEEGSDRCKACKRYDSLSKVGYPWDVHSNGKSNSWAGGPRNGGDAAAGAVPEAQQVAVVDRGGWYKWCSWTGLAAVPPPQTCDCCGREAASGRRDAVADEWFCDRCWEKWAAVNEGLRGELPARWFVQGGQRWAWAAPGANTSGFIEFSRGGRLDTTWGAGTWRVDGEEMEVAFGYPQQLWRLRRTRRGFRCAPPRASDEDCTRGWPLYGVAARELPPGPLVEAMERLGLPRLWEFFRLPAAALLRRLAAQGRSARQAPAAALLAALLALLAGRLALRRAPRPPR